MERESLLEKTWKILALDESTDITDLPQLAVFIRFVSPDFVVKEELLDLVALQESTRGVDIKNALDSIMKTFDVPLNKLVSFATDRAPAMLGKKIGLIGLLRHDSHIPQFIPIHCIIHQEHLVTKYLKYPDVMKTILLIVNYNRTNAKNHRQCKNFLQELKDEELPNDINFFCIVRWLSSYNVLNRFVYLFDPITTFLKKKDEFNANVAEGGRPASPPPRPSAPAPAQDTSRTKEPPAPTQKKDSNKRRYKALLRADKD
ncbi:general transcription factor II-I repeat domain-containing protein 2A-like [Calliopsis andreniformis]|uniref:general transcription factor II-I repeat domain-containing protein 2A-like n=1 Tax=Calliopsis andreniformis TaxID=337506 RepID=UPI003FCCAA62